MKKMLIIALVDGRELARDITLQGAPIGAKANDIFYAGLCQSICANGYTDIDKVTDECYVHLSPSQIKSVTVAFVNN